MIVNEDSFKVPGC